jgi:hypothetical protein
MVESHPVCLLTAGCLHYYLKSFIPNPEKKADPPKEDLLFQPARPDDTVRSDGDQNTLMI